MRSILMLLQVVRPLRYNENINDGKEFITRGEKTSWILPVFSDDF